MQHYWSTRPPVSRTKSADGIGTLVINYLTVANTHRGYR